MKTKNNQILLNNNTIIVGEVKSKIIVRNCCLCKNNFILLTNDYIFNKYGIILHRPSEGADDWICKDCAFKIQKIKELI